MKTTEQKIEELEKQLQKLKSEIKPEFKKGDFIYDYKRVENIQIYSGSDKCIAQLMVESNLLYLCGITGTDITDCRFATESEKQQLIDKLRENGKDWDAEKCEIMDYRWRAKDEEKYFFLASDNLAVIESEEVSHGYDTERYKNGNYFKTKELAEAAAEKVKELLLTLKHS